MSGNIHIKTSTIIWIVVGILFFVWLLWPIEEYTTFSFIIEETNDTINGEIFLDGVFLGSTQEGKRDIGYLEIIPSEITFKGEYKGEKFEVLYDFPSDYLEYYEIPFSISEEYIGEFEDTYSNITELHWGHMPLIYKFDEDLECYSSEKNKVELAFSELSRVTNNSVSFIPGENYDILITCPGILSGRTIGESTYSYYPDVNLITDGELILYRGRKHCGWYPMTELHELLHLFGYGHEDAPGIYSIIAEEEFGCSYGDYYKGSVKDYAIDGWIREDLISIYG